MCWCAVKKLLTHYKKTSKWSFVKCLRSRACVWVSYLQLTRLTWSKLTRYVYLAYFTTTSPDWRDRYILLLLIHLLLTVCFFKLVIFHNHIGWWFWSLRACIWIWWNETSSAVYYSSYPPLSKCYRHHWERVEWVGEFNTEYSVCCFWGEPYQMEDCTGTGKYR